MESLTNIKASVFAILAVAGSIITKFLGGWDMALQALLIFMLIDYITGLVVAGVFKKSSKTDTGALESRAGFKGIVKKIMTLLLVVMGYQLDLLLDVDYLRTGLIIAFIVDEGMSVIENIGLMGIPLPDILIKAFDMLQKNEVKE